MAKYILGSIETGGTKTKCAIGLYDTQRKSIPKILDQTQFPTTSPDQTMALILSYFRSKQRAMEESPTARKYHATAITAFGIACFGPIDPNPQSQTFGYLTTTPKPLWRHYNFVGTLLKDFPVAIAWDTDVNAPALAENLWGAAIGLDPVLYITVGTGIGGGAVVGGRPLHGLMHPEMGHVLVRSHEHDGFSGCCPYHDYCLEGMASGSSMHERWQIPPQELEPAHIAWEVEAFYLAQGLQSYILTLAPQKILMGGGVMQQQQLFPLVRQQLKGLLNDYIHVPQLLGGLEDYISPPALGEDVGLYGGFALAARELPH